MNSGNDNVLLSCHLQKFSNDSAIARCTRGEGESEYTAVFYDLVAWSELKHLQLSVTKTRNLVVNLIMIQWTSRTSTEVLYRECHSHLHSPSEKAQVLQYLLIFFNILLSQMLWFAGAAD